MPRRRRNRGVSGVGNALISTVRFLGRAVRELRGVNMPPIQTSSTIRKKIRYRAAADFNYLPTIQDFLDQFAIIITSSTAKRLMNAFKLHSVTIFMPPTQETTDETPIDGTQGYFSWSTGGSAASSSAGGDSKVYVLQSFGTATMTKRTFTPPPGSQASFWHDTTSGGAQTPLFDMLILSGQYVDMDLSYTMSTGNSTFGASTFNNVISTVSAATPGTFGIRGFPPASGTQVLLPYGFNNV